MTYLAVCFDKPLILSHLYLPVTTNLKRLLNPAIRPEQQDLTFCDLAIMVFLTLPADILPIISASIIEPTNLNFTTSERLLSARLHLSNIEQQIDQWKEVYETVHDELHHTMRILFRRTQSGASDRHGISQARSWMNKNQEFMKHIREQSTDLVKERKVVRAQVRLSPPL